MICSLVDKSLVFCVIQGCPAFSTFQNSFQECLKPCDICAGTGAGHASFFLPKFETRPQIDVGSDSMKMTRTI